MIRKIGIIAQDANSIGFLRGLKERLECEAELVDPPARIGCTQFLPRNKALLAWEYFKKKRVDLIIRFTDANGSRWQEVQRKEKEVFPQEAQSLLVCGVAVNTVEEWLGLDAAYLAKFVQVPESELADANARTGRIKTALVRAMEGDESKSETIKRFVSDAPAVVFKKWLGDAALRRFYQDSRLAASQADCDVRNELGDAD
ncbi:MAG: hypothetical protein V3V49_03840 [Candidatus Krumholzibacteria bacterium]